MNITALGHESWFLSTGKSNILIDPLIRTEFGSCSYRPFRIVPERAILLDFIPSIRSIFYTSEHLQHFDPGSLQKLSKFKNPSEVTVYIPELMPFVAEETINELGFKTVRLLIGKRVPIEDFYATYYSCDKEPLFWDSRVASLYLETNDQSVFFQSDTKISEKFYEDVKRQVCARPTLLVVTNNFSSSSEGYSIGLDNMLPVKDEKYTRAAGLRLLKDLISDPIRKLGCLPAVAIAGNGYNTYDNAIDHLWSNNQLASSARKLSILGNIFSLDPGQTYNVESRAMEVEAKWISTSCKSENAVEGSRQDLARNHEPKLSELKFIEDSLNEMAKSWLISEYGQVLMSQHNYLGNAVGPQRLCFVVTHRNDSVKYVLDISKVEFLRVEIVADPIKKYPFGVVVDIDDLLGLLTGKIQIWEVMNLSLSQWYVCSRFQSPIAFLLEYFDEQVEPRLTKEVYKKILQNSEKQRHSVVNEVQ